MLPRRGRHPAIGGRIVHFGTRVGGGSKKPGIADDENAAIRQARRDRTPTRGGHAGGGRPDVPRRVIDFHRRGDVLPVVIYVPTRHQNPPIRQEHCGVLRARRAHRRHCCPAIGREVVALCGSNGRSGPVCAHAPADEDTTVSQSDSGIATAGGRRQRDSGRPLPHRRVVPLGLGAILTIFTDE